MRRQRSISVYVLAALTILYGLWHMIIGGVFIWAGFRLLQEPSDGWGFLANMAGAVVMVIGVPVACHGILNLICGLGIWRRNFWIRILAIVTAAFTISLGILCLFAPENAHEVIFYGIAQIVFGVASIVVLAVYGNEFALRPQHEVDYGPDDWRN